MKRFLLAACLAAFGLAADAKACNPVGVSALVAPVVVSGGVTFDALAYQQALAAQIRSQQLFAQSFHGGGVNVLAIAPPRRVVRRPTVSAFGNQAQAVGNQAAVVRTGGLRGLIFGDVSRAR